MGYALRLPGLTITNPTAPTALLEAMGVSGLTHRFEADSFTGAVGSAITGGWLNKITGVATAANTAGALVGAKVGIAPTVDFKTGTGGDFGIDGLTAGAKTITYVGQYNGTAKFLDLEGRKFWLNGTGWTLEKLDGTGTNKIVIPFTTLPQPATGTMYAVAITLSADGSADSLRVKVNGAVTTASGPVDKTTSTRLRIGPGGHTAGFGPVFSAVGVWGRVLTGTEITDKVFPAFTTRYGLPA